MNQEKTMWDKVIDELAVMRREGQRWPNLGEAWRRVEGKRKFPGKYA